MECLKNNTPDSGKLSGVEYEIEDPNHKECIIMYYNNNIGENTTPAVKIRKVKNSEYSWEVIEGGRQGTIVKEKITNAKNEEKTVIHTLPPIAGRYEKGDGVIYLIPAQTQGFLHANAEEVEKGTIWGKRGVRKEQSAMKNPVLKDIWYEIAESWEIVPPSPTVYDGLPLTAPETLVPKSENPEEAKAAWAELGVRLSPLGRWVIGTTLMSPWVKKIKSGNSYLIHLVGEGGAGKSVLARAAASLFGPPDGAGEGLFSSFNSSNQGISSYAQGLSYYPVILDEIQSSTGNVNTILIDLLTGANRKRAGRSGNAIVSKASWYGVIITTGNDPLDFSGVKHEQYDRRMVNIQAGDLWNRDMMPTEALELDEWWDETVELFTESYGWAWEELTRTYTPGQLTAQELPKKFDELNNEIRKPAADIGGTIGLLGILGCQWLSEWTGDSAWVDGVYPAVQHLLWKRRTEKKDVAREAANAILDDMAANPKSWSKNESEDFLQNNAHGYPSSNDARSSIVKEKCKVNHEESHCLWYDCLRPAFNELVEIDKTRLFANPKFRKALYIPNEALENPMRKIKIGSKRLTALTFCQYGMSIIADEEQPVEFIGTPTEVEIPETKFETTTKETMMRRIGNTSEPGTLPVLDENNQPTYKQVGEHSRLITKPNLKGMVDKLEKAADNGITDLVVSNDWDGTLLKELGWSTKSAGGSLSYTMNRDRDGARVRLYRTPSNEITTNERLIGVKALLKKDSYFTTPSMLGTNLLKAPYRGAAPRFQLETAMADRWKSENILQTGQWGKTRSERKELSLQQYDRNKAHLSSMSNALVAPLYLNEAWTQFGSNAPIDRKWAGMYLIEVPEWTIALPSPYGNNEPGTQLWTSNEIMKFVKDLVNSGKYPTISMPKIIEAYLAPQHKVNAIQKTAETFKAWLKEYEECEPARKIVKEAYQAFAGSLSSEEYGKGKYGKVYRPDWGQAIKDNSWCNVLRDVYKVYEIDNRYIPVAVNIDAIYYPAELPTPLGLRLGDGLGEYKDVK